MIIVKLTGFILKEKHEYNESLLKMYEDLGMFNGGVSREFYETMCKKCIDHED